MAALAAALAAVGAAVLTSDDPPEARPKPPAGAPPLLLDLGVRTDPEARALRGAVALYFGGRRRDAGNVFVRHRSLDAQVGAALSAWPRGTTPRLEDLARAHPRSALVRLHLGLARYWRGDRAGAVAAWRAAAEIQPDTLSAVRADDLLHPNFPRGLPQFVPSVATPKRITRLRADRQLAVLEREARRPSVRAKLTYGAALQRLGKQLSARRVFAAAAELAPRDPEPLTALAVARFTKAHPERTFSRLGPLSRRHPRAVTVRFHLGLCLLWLGQVAEGRRQLRLAAATGRGTLLAREARRLLAGIEKAQAQGRKQ